MRRRTTEEAIPTESAQDLLVRREYGGIRATWLCGDSVFFDWATLRKAIAYVEMFPPDIWVYQQSSDGTGFTTRLDGERFHITPGEMNGANVDVVHWSELKASLEEALSAGTANQQDEDPDASPASKGEGGMT